MRVQLFGNMIVPGWAVSDRRYAGCLAVLACMWDDPRVARHVVCDADAGVLSIDVHGLLQESSWSSVERLIVHTAVGLYGAVVGDAGDSLGLLVETLDDDTLDRILDAVAVRRGRAVLRGVRLPAVSERAEELRSRLAVEREVVALRSVKR